MVDIKSRILEVFQQTHLMSLATVNETGPWVCDVVFIYDDDLNIYWMSDPETRHSQAIKNNNKVAATITFSTKSKIPNFGIQLEGTAEKLEGVQYDLLIKHLAKRSYPKPDISEAEKILDGDSWYKIAPNKICLIDEENFGYNRQDIEL